MSAREAVVIGAGPNGLVGANILADAGWDVTVLEANAEPGGAVRSGEITVPGFTHDLFSAFYPLGAASPALGRLDLHEHGLRWRRAPLALAHVFEDHRCAVLSQDVDETAASVERFGAGDGDAWRRLVDRWNATSDLLIPALLEPFPPVLTGLRLAARLVRTREVMEFARFAVLPVRRFSAEHFRGEGASMLIAGNTLHTDLSPEGSLGALYGWLLAMLGQTVGFPVPEGGAGQLTAALVRRLESRGGRIRCNARVTEVVVRDGAAVAVRTEGGDEVGARDAVLADVAAPALYLKMVGPEHLPGSTLAALERFDRDHGTVKVDWSLSGPVPWLAEEARRAGTVHVGGGMDHLTQFAADLAMGQLPRSPFLLFGQLGKADPTRSPEGTETAWAYTHVPNPVDAPAAATWDERTTAAFADRVEEEIEARAPGFRSLILGRHVFNPTSLEEADANLIGGSLNGGTAQLHQQLVFRPTPGRGGPRTPVKRLYLASSSAHPGGGVHGACGANAARAAIRAARVPLR